MKPSPHLVLPPVATRPATIALSRIHPSPLNPRMVAEAQRADLAESLKASGQLMRVWVRPHPAKPGEYELVDGERRWWGAKSAGLATLDAEVGDWSDEHILQITWVTGTEGRGLTVIEQARWADGAMKRPGATLESVGALVGVARDTLHKRLRLLDLPDFALGAVQAGILAPHTAYLIASVPGPARVKFAREVLKPEDVPGPLTYLAALALRGAAYMRTLKGAPFDVADAALVPAAGPCSGCRFRAGNNLQEYGEVKNPHTCMNVECFAAKEAAVRARVAAREAGGKRALSSEENAAVFPPGSEEPSPSSGYALAARPIPADLLKPEVAAQGAPSFAATSPAATVVVGTDGQGRVVDLVRVDEAVAVTSEPAIFKAEVAAAYGLRDNEGGRHRDTEGRMVHTPAMRDVAPAASEPAPTSLAGEQKREQRAKAKAEKTKAKHLRACAEWMLELNNALTAPAARQPAGYAYARASLRWEHLILTVADEDALLVLNALSAEAPAKGQSGKDALKEWVAALGGEEELSAVVDLLLIASALRAQGVEAKWVAEWHRHLVQPVEALRAGKPAAEAGVILPNTEAREPEPSGPMRNGGTQSGSL